MACVLGVEKRIRAVGPRYLLLSKFIPGVGNLAAAASGFAGVGAWRFLLLDGAALGLWATAYAGLGRIFSTQVEVVIEWVLGLGRLALVLAAILILAAGMWRFVKVRMHRPHHEAARAAGADGTQDGRAGESARNSSRHISSTNAS
jgi:membrane protein DedA with SNARE-associated domain